VVCFHRRVGGVTVRAGDTLLWALMKDEKHGYQIRVFPRRKHGTDARPQPGGRTLIMVRK
jgi:hypothetical protein